MLILASRLEKLDVVSMRSGQMVGRLKGAVLDPNELKLVAFYVSAEGRQQLCLRSQDIREVRAGSVLVDDEEELVAVEDLVRLQSLLKLSYTLFGKKVTTESGQGLGKVEDYVVEDTTFYIEKLHVKQSLIKSFTTSNLVIGRPQIVEVTDSAVVVRDAYAEAVQTKLGRRAGEVKPGLGVPGVLESDQG